MSQYPIGIAVYVPKHVAPQALKWIAEYISVIDSGVNKEYTSNRALELTTIGHRA